MPPTQSPLRFDEIPFPAAGLLAEVRPHLHALSVNHSSPLSSTATKKLDPQLVWAATQAVDASITQTGKGEFCRLYTKAITTYQLRDVE